MAEISSVAKNSIETNLNDIKNRLSLALSGSAGDDSNNADSIAFAWFVGACGYDSSGKWTDFSDTYVSEGRWENRYDDKFLEEVKQMAVGDRIAIKAAYTKKKDLPFDNAGKTVGVMSIKAIGIITGNANDGKNVSVDWVRIDPIREWYGAGVLRQTLHKIVADEGYIRKALIDFTFLNVPQDYSICEEQYKDDVPEDSIPDGTEEESNYPNIKLSCLDVKRSPRTTKVHPLNCIIYGAPGTGKTYATAEYALAIIEERPVDKTRKTFTQRRAVMDKYNEFVRKGQVVFTTFHQSYGYEEFIQGLRPDTKSEHMSFITSDGVFKRIADAALVDKDNNYLIIIDEINRANISKVFGELITLIEDDKRWGEVNETCATLQSGDVFAVPNNLYIVGTMNSADKSISLIDAALRRRFEFFEQYPDADLIDDAVLKSVFNKINIFLADSLESSDLLVGHSYFMNKTEADLCAILNNSIIPLLYEYYYDNKKKVISVLTDALKDLKIEIKDPKISRVYVVAKEVETEA